MRTSFIDSGRITALVSALVLSAASVMGCSGKSPAPAPACDQSCQDGVGLLALRQTMKLAFNVTLQGKPVGAQDATAPCPLGGSVRIFGTATSNATQGTTDVDLTYVLNGCSYLQVDTDPSQNYNVVLTGTITQKGILAVQPSATTALQIKSDAVTITGTVYDPPLTYDASSCAMVLGQNGNELSGTLCGRTAGVTL